MELMKWNPMRDILGVRPRFGRLFDDFFYPELREGENESLWNWNPVVDIYDNDKNLVIKAELPGIDKKDITLDVKENRLTLRGERSADNEVNDKNYYRRERVYGKFERVFTLPGDVDLENIKADYKDGVLKIEVPKPEEKQPKKITVH